MNKWQNPIIIDFINYMGKDPLVALQQEANYLLKKTEQFYNINDFSSIDVDRIADHLKLKEGKYKYNNFLNSTARIIQESLNSVKIELNKDKSNYINYRHHFIIAHEIGHWVIRTKINKIYSEKEIDKINKHKYEEELLCHFFASELLMPKKIFVTQTQNKILNEKLIFNLHNQYKVPEFHIINRILLLYHNFIGIYWKKKESLSSKIKLLRVSNYFPDNRIKEQPYIPIYATAKTGRFTPNFILKSFNTNDSLTGNIYIENFGDIKGNYETYVYNPNKNEILFNEYKYERKFDLITIFKEIQLPTKAIRNAGFIIN